MDHLADLACWQSAQVGRVAHFHPRSSGHHPPVEFRLLRGPEHLFLRYDVKDQFVRMVRSLPQSTVCQDSCVEFFVQPNGDGYLNFEFSANGTPLCYHIRDCAREVEGFADFEPLAVEDLARLQMAGTLLGRNATELTEPIDWFLAVAIPLDLLARAGGGRPQCGDQWRGNFYKCADHSSHPHWAYWNDIGPELNFHLPNGFAPLQFA